MAAIKVESLELVFESGKNRLKVLDIPQWQVEGGEHFALFGPSGSGKTTFLNLLAGLLTPHSGRLKVCGHSLEDMPEAQRDRFRAQCIGYIYQNFNLLQGFNALENVLLGMTFGPRKGELKDAESLLNEVGLSHRLNFYPSQLSLGEQQRVAVARALANRPQLILADEPTGSLDPKNRDAVLKLLKDVCRNHGCTLVLVSHERDVIAWFEKAIPFLELNRAFQPMGGMES
ncbi:MAG: ABC transporter ATP-binding protein [Thermodesulfobacteriota bacterium]|nr:ABC transporter ATP-binding protein [Thermodesulfobacteriota bacterium]